MTIINITLTLSLFTTDMMSHAQYTWSSFEYIFDVLNRKTGHRNTWWRKPCCGNSELSASVRPEQSAPYDTNKIKVSSSNDGVPAHWNCNIRRSTFVGWIMISPKRLSENWNPLKLLLRVLTSPLPFSIKREGERGKQRNLSAIYNYLWAIKFD